MSTNMIIMSLRRYKSLMRQLARRGGAYRESGGFLLAATDATESLGGVEVVDIAYYDDLDPGSLTGGITMHDVGFAALNRRCREGGLTVVGDVHTHPRSMVRQSRIDSDNPMIAFAGHIAIIAPTYGQGMPRPHTLGIHVFLGGGRWQSYFGRDGESVLRVITWPTRVATHLRSLIKGRGR